MAYHIRQTQIIRKLNLGLASFFCWEQLDKNISAKNLVLSRLIYLPYFLVKNKGCHSFMLENTQSIKNGLIGTT